MASKTGISVNWGGFKDMVGEATANISDTKDLMRNIGVAMKAGTVRRFQAGEGPDGEGWTAVKTGSRKNRRGRARPLLDTGRLRKSLAISATATEVHVGSNLVYARIHQLGGQAGPGRKVTIPARPFLGISEEDREEITALIKEHLEGNFK